MAAAAPAATPLPARLSAEPEAAAGEPVPAGEDVQPFPGEPGAPLPPGFGCSENRERKRVQGEHCGVLGGCLVLFLGRAC